MERVENSVHKQKEAHLPVNVFIKANECNLSLKKDQPDCLTKVLGKPILFYLLEFLERNFIKEVTILTTSEFSYDISSTIQELFTGSIKTIVLTASTDKLEGMNVFGCIERKLTESNFILINGNSLLDFDLVEMFNEHLLNNEHISLCLSKTETEGSNTESRPKLSPYNNEIEIVSTISSQVFGLKSYDNQVDTKSKSDIKNEFKKVIYSSIVNNKSSFKISTEVLNKFEDFDLEWTFQDIDFYIIKRSIYDLLHLDKIKSFESIKYDLIPFLINKQDHRIIKSTLKSEMRIRANLLYGVSYKIDSFSKLIGVLNEIQKPIKDIMTMFFPTKNNDENIFVEYRSSINVNMQNNRNPTYDLPAHIKMISMDSYVAKPIEMEGIKVSISKSIVGKSCKISGGTKILNSFLMDNCIIGKNCEIANCILEKGVVVKDNTTLKNLIIREGDEISNSRD